MKMFCNTEEWSNFSERVNDPKRIFSEKDKTDQLREWVSYRGQTLSRTGILSECCRSFYLYVCGMRSLMCWKSLLLLVRGMMYYRMALELQCFQEYTEYGLYFLQTYRFYCLPFLPVYASLLLYLVVVKGNFWKVKCCLREKKNCFKNYFFILQLPIVATFPQHHMTSLWTAHELLQIWNSHMSCHARYMGTRKSQVTAGIEVVTITFYSSC